MNTYLIISDYACYNGGCAKVAIQTAIGLANCGKRVIFFAGGGSTTPDLVNENIKVINLNMPDLLSGNKFKMFFLGIKNHKAMVELSKLLDNYTDNLVIHIHSWVKVLSPGIFLVLSKRKRKFAITAHDYFLICPNGGYYNYKHKHICSICERKHCLKNNCDSRNYFIKIWRYIRNIKQKKYLKKCDFKLITLSNLMKKQFDLYNIESIIIHNPIDLNTSPINISKQPKSFAYIGRLSEEKGVSLFCEALQKTGYKGFVFGNGPKEEELINKFRVSKNIVFMGRKSFKEISLYFDQILCIVFPSKWYEGAPLIIPEAQSFGLYSIVSNASSAVDYIDDNNGYIFETNNLDDLVSKMNDVYTLNTSNLIRNEIQKKALSQYNNLNKYIFELLSFYNDNL